MPLTLTYIVSSWHTRLRFVPFGTLVTKEECLLSITPIPATTFMSEYTPSVLTSHDWELVREFVTEAVTATFETASRYQLRKSALGVARLSLDALNHGLMLEPEQVFDADFIEYHVSRLGLADTSTSSLRALLVRIGRTVSLSWNGRRETPAYPTSMVNTPYTDEDVRVLNDWALSCSTERSRENAAVLLALGFGAGLRNSEVDTLTVADVTVTSAGVVVHPHGYRGASARYVPVHTEYEQTIRDHVRGRDPEDFLFLPGERVTGRSCASDFVRRVHLPPVPVTLSRMRTTWIVRLMKAFIPESAICEVAGLRDLQHYAHYRDQVDTASAQAFEDQIRYAGASHLPRLRAI